MASGKSEDFTKQILILSDTLISKNKFGHFTKVFTDITTLYEYIYEHIKDIDTFQLHISHQYLDELMKKSIHKIKKIRRIYIYYNSDNALQSSRNGFPSESEEEDEKFEFCLERDLEQQIENAEVGRSIDPSRPIDHPTLHNIVDTKIERISAKRTNSSDHYSAEPKRFSPAIQGDSIEKINYPCYICPSCKKILMEPYQLECGHRLCKSCVNIRVSCSICSDFILKDKARSDRGFKREMDNLSTTCLECQWIGSFEDYQKHLIQNHQTISNEQIVQCSRYSSKINQMYQKILSVLRFICPVNNNSIDINQIQSEISALLNNIKVLHDDIERMDRKPISYQHFISIVPQQWFVFDILFQEITGFISEKEVNKNLLYHQLLSLKNQVEDVQATFSNDGFIWKIPNFEEKIMNAKPDRYNSIYSLPFYSSETGYKMCLQLFLNGDNNTRDTHIALHLIIMRGNYDANLYWPFKYKITFSLLNQLSLRNNDSVVFWPDKRSNSFQCPITDRNIPYGIPKFFPLNVLEQNKNQYVKNDTIFIKVTINYSAETPEIPLNTGATPSGTFIVLWFGEKYSSLRTALIENLIPNDITLILFSSEEQLWHWLNINISLRVVSLVIQTNINIQNILSRCHMYNSICSILIRCETNELITLQRFSRSFIKIDGIYDNDIRLLLKLVIDLALYSEEVGDQQREIENNELEAQRNYDRALKLCALARKR